MRKKQVFAILLAGAMTAGTVPSAALAAENDIPAVSSEITEGENSGEIPQEEGQTPPAEPTQAPETTPEAPMETPVEPTEAPAVPETPAEPTQAPETETTPEATPSAAPETLEAETTGISITTIGENNQETITYYKTLQEAVDAVPTIESGAQEPTVIEITDSLVLSETVSVSGKRVSIVAAAPGITIRREQKEDGTVFNGNMFTVSGQNSKLQLSAKDGSDLTVDGNNGKGVEEPSEGSLADVSDSGCLGISAGVTLTGNNTTAKGGAVSNNGGSIVLMGGTITGNTGAVGAVYSNMDIAVQGTVTIKENTGANIYLDQDASVVVTDVLTGSSISLTAAAPADKKIVAKAGNKADSSAVTSEEFKAAAEQLAYDTQDYSVVLGEDGLSAVLKINASATVTPSPTPTTSPSFLTYQSKSLKWMDHNTAVAKMSTTKDCKWYYYFVDAGSDTNTIKKLYDSKKAKTPAKANTTFTVKAEKVPEKDSWLVVAAKPDKGSAQLRVLKLNSSSRPASPSVSPTVTTRAPRKYKVTESKVTGLENPLKFFPRKKYEFSVIGAGQNDTNPISGDERWVPQHWAMSVNGAIQGDVNDPDYHHNPLHWTICSSKGIREAAIYPLYIFFQKQTYNGTEWTSTDVVEYMKTSFSSAEISDAEWKDYIDNYNKEHPDDGLNYDGTGGGSVADIKATEAASEKDSGSTSKSAVATADEAPVGTMSVLAALSLLAGGYVIVRKRKKEEI